MIEFIRLCAGFVAAMFRSHVALQAENLALRHQLGVYQRSVKRPTVRPADRVLWRVLAKVWTGCGNVAALSAWEALDFLYHLKHLLNKPRHE